MSDLAGIVARDAAAGGFPTTKAHLQAALGALPDRRALLVLLRETRDALSRTHNQLLVEHGAFIDDTECSGCAADDIRDTNRPLLIALAALDVTP